jgi:non-ribosomal peptide synthase protein (TIGR01720 family)
MTTAPGDRVHHQTDIERALVQIWSEVLGVSSIRAEDDFFSLGGDSLLSIQVVAKAKSRGIPLDYRMIFRSPTIRQLAASVEVRYTPSPSPSASAAVPLTPIQSRFFETAGSQVNHWNQWVLLDVKRPLRLQDLCLSVEELRRAHDVLRLQFHRDDETWRQTYRTPDARTPVRWIDLSACPVEARSDALDVLNDEANQALSLEEGDLIRFVYVDLGTSSPHKLLIVAHHLIMDNVSFHLLVNDLDACLSQCAEGAAPRLEPDTCTYQAWSDAQTRSAEQGRFEPESDFWLAQMTPAATPLPRDERAESSENTYASMRSWDISFSEPQTRTIVNKLPTLLHCHINSILLDALASAVYESFGVDEVVIDIESHGRQWIDDAVDLRKATGWYTSIYPQRFTKAGGRAAYDRLRSVDSQLKAVPNGGIGYGVLRYLAKTGDAASALTQAPRAPICFNYLGQVGRSAKGLSAFSTDNMRVGASHARELRRSHLLFVQSAVTDGRLVVQCQYSARVHREDTIKRLLESVERHLNGLLPSVVNGFRRSFRQLAWERAETGETLDVLQQIAVVYPLLGLQTSILFQHLTSQGGVAPYLVQVSCTLRGEFIASAFERAWQTVVARHESLRTSFHWDGLDAPVQAVHRSGHVSMKVLDWRHKEATLQQVDLQRAVRNDRLAGMSLEGAEPLMRITVIRLTHDTSFCIWTHHHLQLDGWSQIIVLRELFQLYRGIVTGIPAVLPPPPSLGDYFRALDRFPTAEAGKYWRRYLQGFREPTPILRTVDQRAGDNYRDLAISIGTADSDAIHEFAKVHSLTLHTIFSALWGLWLSMHSDRDDVVFGDVVSGRSAEMESVQELVGTVINTIPVRMRLDDSLSVLQWLNHVQADQAASHRYELFPLAEAVKLSDVDKGRLLFDSILVFESFPVEYEALVAAAGFHLDSIDFTIQENYPVVVIIKPDRPVTARINYRADVVDPRIRHAQAFFSIALSALTRDDGRSLLAFRQSLRAQYEERVGEEEREGEHFREVPS